MKYRCNVCNVFEYDDEIGDSQTNIKPGIKPEDFPDDWQCPICTADKTHQQPGPIEAKKISFEQAVICPKCGSAHTITITQEETLDVEGYLGEWKRESDDLEKHMADIHKISATGQSIIEPMRTREEVISWENILIKPRLC